MKHWSRTRRISLIVHVLFVSVPFFASSISALLLWRDLFDSWWLAVPMVLVIDVLALTGLILTIARIPSPFVPLRHVLPFISIIPLGRELYLLLQHNDGALVVVVTAVVTAIFTFIAWKCFETIEALFIDPVEAARERVQHEMRQMHNDLEALHTRNVIMDQFMIERLQYRGTPIIEADTERVTVAQDAPLPTPQFLPRPPVEPQQFPGFVYLLRTEGEQYKIGRAKDVTTRVRAIASLVPFAVEVVHTIETNDANRLERCLHFVYESAGKRINGEWFHLAEQDIQAIQAIGSQLDSDAFDDTLDMLSLVACPPSDTLAEYPDTDPVYAARQLRQQGISWREVARRVGMSDTTLRRRLRDPE